MEREFTSLMKFLRKALRHLWVLIGGAVWSAFGSFTRFRDNFLPDSLKESLQTQHLLHKIPPMTWTGWAIGILALVIFAVVRSALKQIHERETMYFDASDEVERLNGQPINIELTILEILQRPSFETHAQLNRDVFLRVSANLISPFSADVDYELSVILRGKTVESEWLRDVDQWCRTEIVRNPSPLDAADDKPCFYIDEMPTHLEMGQKVEAWLHFRTKHGLQDGMMSKCSLRLLAKSAYGAGHRDMPEGCFPVIPRGWKIVPKATVRAYAERSADNPLPPPV